MRWRKAQTIGKEKRNGMNGLKKLERRFGKYAIPNLMLYVTILYAAGVVISLTSPELLSALALDFGKVLHGQVCNVYHLSAAQQ